MTSLRHTPERPASFNFSPCVKVNRGGRALKFCDFVSSFFPPVTLPVHHSEHYKYTIRRMTSVTMENSTTLSQSMDSVNAAAEEEVGSNP